jgi:hydrogenase nickel incorporation protein HypB
MTEKNTVKIYKDLQGENEVWAAKTREVLKKNKICMVNIIGSPGCGKTTLLEKSGQSLAKKMRFAVLEGDVETTRDAERLQAQGILSSQLLTSGACHLEAKLVHYALLDLPLDTLDLVIVENVGNLVCPAEFDIGEHAKIAVLSVTEGEDKPIKYPLLFSEAACILITKTDLLPYLPYKLEACLDFIRQVNPSAPIIQAAPLKGLGMQQWIDWLIATKNHAQTDKH